MKKIFKLLTIAAIALGFAACSDDDPKYLPVTTEDVTLTLPANVSASSLYDATITLTNVANREVTTLAYPIPAGTTILPGLYDVEFSAKTKLENDVEAEVKASQRSVQIDENNLKLELNAFVNVTKDDLVIAEIFFTGTQQENGSQYASDGYVKLYNNTDHVVYADGIALIETKFLTNQKYEYDPDKMSEAVAVDAVYVVPGSGKDHPVQPGEYFLIADNAVNHIELNPYSFDLSHADFEWYDESSNPRYQDLQNENVPDLDKWYCYTKTIWNLHNRGFKSYGIARLQGNAETFLENNAYHYTYKMVLPSGTFDMKGDAYLVPNDQIIDFVNLSIESNFAWTLCAPSIDMGWTHCGSVDMDKTRYFKSVRRKYLTTTEDGRIILQDTNNSTNDFNADAIPSEIERQKTVYNADGAKYTGAETIDGVTPKK